MFVSSLRILVLMILARLAPVRIWQDRRAVTAIEYAIIAGALAAVIVASMTRIGPELTPTFNSVSSEL